MDLAPGSRIATFSPSCPKRTVSRILDITYTESSEFHRKVVKKVVNKGSKKRSKNVVKKVVINVVKNVVKNVVMDLEPLFGPFASRF